MLLDETIFSGGCGQPRGRDSQLALAAANALARRGFWNTLRIGTVEPLALPTNAASSMRRVRATGPESVAARSESLPWSIINLEQNTRYKRQDRSAYGYGCCARN